MTKLGVLTPSSNTALELMVPKMIVGLPGVSAHFSRFRVERIGLDKNADAQFDRTEILHAARLLSHAKVDVIGWLGTAASWRGFQNDQVLCSQIFEELEIPGDSAVLALNRILRRSSLQRLGLITPYTNDVTEAIAAQYRENGWEVVDTFSAGLSTNFDFALVTEQQLFDACERMVNSGAEVIVTMCTNMVSPQLAEKVEKTFGVYYLDSMTAGVAGLLETANSELTLKGWGRLFEAH